MFGLVPLRGLSMTCIWRLKLDLYVVSHYVKLKLTFYGQSPIPSVTSLLRADLESPGQQLAQKLCMYFVHAEALDR